MLKTILFDLDNTLLGNDMQDFIPRYFALLGEYAEKYLPRNLFLQHLMQATDGMVRNTDPQRSNHEVFWAEFARLSGLQGEELVEDFDQFYLNEFGQLRDVTVPQAAALPLIERARDQGLEIVVATNPMFPRRAVEARLAWAGLPVEEQAFTLVTTIENMHATKPHEAYYEEILAQIGRSPQESLMVGDDWGRDIVPAANVGLWTYWIQLPGVELPAGPLQPTAYGTLDDLLALARSGWFKKLGSA
jgi:FMN phosphatase YigB (HAD superfamily)